MCSIAPRHSLLLLSRYDVFLFADVLVTLFVTSEAVLFVLGTVAIYALAGIWVVDQIQLLLEHKWPSSKCLVKSTLSVCYHPGCAVWLRWMSLVLAGGRTWRCLCVSLA